jgi:hypothetical protein
VPPVTCDVVPPDDDVLPPAPLPPLETAPLPVAPALVASPPDETSFPDAAAPLESPPLDAPPVPLDAVEPVPFKPGVSSLICSVEAQATVTRIPSAVTIPRRKLMMAKGR